MTKNTGTVAVPSFGSPELAYEDYRGGDAADFDGDGQVDFMMFGDDTWSNDAIHLELLFPNTNPSPSSSEPDYFRWPLIDREATDIAVADADNDGDLDVFGCIEYEQEINFLENLGDGHLPLERSTAPGFIRPTVGRTKTNRSPMESLKTVGEGSTDQWGWLQVTSWTMASRTWSWF